MKQMIMGGIFGHCVADALAGMYYGFEAIPTRFTMATGMIHSGLSGPFV